MALESAKRAMPAHPVLQARKQIGGAHIGEEANSALGHGENRVIRGHRVLCGGAV